MTLSEGSVRRVIQILVLLSLCYFSRSVVAETYKCSKGGQAVFSDVPCASGASRVDAHSDVVSREQRRQAEIIHERNRGQLSELEYRAARERGFRGGVYILGSDSAPTTSTTSSRRSR